MGTKIIKKIAIKLIKTILLYDFKLLSILYFYFYKKHYEYYVLIIKCNTMISLCSNILKQIFGLCREGAFFLTVGKIPKCFWEQQN